LRTKNVILCGDININILDNTSVSNNFLDMMTGFNRVSYINTCTGCFNNSNSCLDHIFSLKIVILMICHDKKKFNFVENSIFVNFFSVFAQFMSSFLAVTF